MKNTTGFKIISPDYLVGRAGDGKKEMNRARRRDAKILQRQGLAEYEQDRRQWEEDCRIQLELDRDVDGDFYGLYD